MRFAVIVFPGSNCDRDSYHAVKEVCGAEAEYMWHKESDLKGCDAVFIPGGFTYGDYLRTGAIAKFAPVMSAVKTFAESGGVVIGVCNGFQILLEAGLLPGAMIRNRSLKFICKHVHLKVEHHTKPFTDFKKDVLHVPVAHGQGNYFCSPEVLSELEKNNRILLRYCSPEGTVSDEFNPNGSTAHIAGITNKAGNVLGMMPHPERASELLLGSDDGKLILDSIIKNAVGPKRAGRVVA